ncbi:MULTISPECIES: RDD family protein [unclassified Leeuwenhoekiella]|uniref:RDD family protein n=1 Tax=unclassified Leeuwenhoekiella TaxID=2615029 RepID=UPI000C5B3144|nr:MULTISPECIES: RDD family protein [unclassified Leeuwenhoekiella]MAW94191.1 RDD family protein [Leeuwenhoekiella sp.]MAW96245.1 RDD family protein [Leeuwenhoekiella sp.]MBA80239.1 RDD family protein [Leeuwenhoekiella sp.]|tara:strand:- start:25863 stop:26294 length:432 start_codon:yes stop_codon:yes gene_type:complete
MDSSPQVKTIVQVYPHISNRIKAAFVDAIVIILLMLLFTDIFSKFESVPDYYKIVAFVFVFLAYEPIMVSVFGFSLGHFLNDLRVKRHSNPSKNLNIFLAIVRFITKSLLGWISLLTISGNPERRAIHDMLSDSVVIFFKKEV